MRTADEQRTNDWGELLQAARAGDDSALGQMCERLRKYLQFVAAAEINGALQAKIGASDLVQQAMLDSYQEFPAFSGNTENEFRSWMRQLIRHNLIDEARRYCCTQTRDITREVSLERGMSHSALIGKELTGSALVGRQERDTALLDAIALLPAKNRRIVQLRHRQGLTHSQIGRQLNMTEAAVRKLWSRTTEMLRQMLSTQDV